nr:MAG TPA: hypothetical protein [Caudoviricetes sp.]
MLIIFNLIFYKNVLTKIKIYGIIIIHFEMGCKNFVNYF